MYCNACGTLISDACKFCPVCGAAVPDAPDAAGQQGRQRNYDARWQEQAEAQRRFEEQIGAPKKRSAAYLWILLGICLVLAAIVTVLLVMHFHNARNAKTAEPLPLTAVQTQAPVYEIEQPAQPAEDPGRTEEAPSASAPAVTTGDTDYSEETQATDEHSPFYGVWVYAGSTFEDAERYAEGYRARGFDARVFLTTDWSNLNSKAYYCVSLGVYATKAEADAALPTAKQYVSSAYVKYSGQWQGG